MFLSRSKMTPFKSVADLKRKEVLSSRRRFSDVKVPPPEKDQMKLTLYGGAWDEAVRRLKGYDD